MAGNNNEMDFEPLIEQNGGIYFPIFLRHFLSSKIIGPRDALVYSAIFNHLLIGKESYTNHTSIAKFLGMNRAGVNMCIINLSRCGLISYKMINAWFVEYRLYDPVSVMEKYVLKNPEIDVSAAVALDKAGFKKFISLNKQKKYGNIFYE